MKASACKSLSVFAGVALLTTGAAPAAVYTQNFTFPNGTGSLGDGTVLTTNGAPGVPATVQNNALELTSVLNGSSQNSFNIPGLANSSIGFTVSFNLTLIDAAGGNPPADGFSFNYGDFTSAANYGEEGVVGGTSISWVVDTWNNTEPGTPPNQGIRSKINGVNDYTQFFAPLADGQTLSNFVTLSWTAANGMSLSLDGVPVFSNRPTPGFTGNNSYLFGFGARTGGATETVSIDNLTITTVPEPAGILLAGVAGLGLMMIRRRR